MSLFNDRGPREQVVVNLFADEVKNIQNGEGERWTYIGLLIVRVDYQRNARAFLEKEREVADYWREMHFAKLRQHPRGPMAVLGKRWLDVFTQARECPFKCLVLGVNLGNLNLEAFGGREGAVYNRFFRSGVLYALKSFLNEYDHIHVSAVFHDKSIMESDELFDWHSIWRISENEPSIAFGESHIKFIDSDHEKEVESPDASHFVQLVDVILGATQQCLDSTSTQSAKIAVAEHFLPEVTRALRGDPWRKDIAQLRKRFKLSFFPSKRLTLEELREPTLRASSTFYTNRTPLLSQRDERNGGLKQATIPFG